MSRKYSRRTFLDMSSFLTAIPGAITTAGSAAAQQVFKPSVEVGTDRQLFVDDYIIEHLDSSLQLLQHDPEPQELSFLFDKPWEGNATGFASVFKDGNVYRMYYGGVQFTIKGTKIVDDSHPYFLCYIESKDGIHWERPNLDLIKFHGSKKNNIIIDDRNVGEASPFPVCAAMFKDDNPLAPPDAKYKTMIRNYSPKRSVQNGLLPMKSPDGIHWTLMSEHPVITDGEFDSQDIAFWDSVGKQYRAYWRYKASNVRMIRTAKSKDFIHWTDVADLRYQAGSPLEELYTNVIKPYYRAPQIFIGLPVRYVDRGQSPIIEELPNPQNRKIRSHIETRFGNAITESLLMSSRDGNLFHRREEAFLRPGIERPGTWNYGQQYIAWSMVETASALEGAPNELSFYAVEGTWGTIPHYPKADGLRRYTLRLDGFISVNAPMGGGEMITRPMTFQGNTLELNFSTSAAGSVQVEIQDDKKVPVPGYTLEDCPEIFGDSVDRHVSWAKGPDISRLKGNSIRLRFVMKDADLYAFKFT